MMKQIWGSTRGFLAAACLAAAGCTEPWPEQALLIEHATLVSAEQPRPIADASVLVVDGHIAWVGGGSPKGRRNTWQRIDAQGLYLTPGLIDGHVHLGHPIALTDAQFEEHPDLVASYRAQLPRSYLFFGFTTVVDPDLREDVRARMLATEVAPNVVGCGRGIRMQDGYGPILFPAQLRDRIFPVWVADAAAPGQEHSPEALIDSLASSGARCIKSYHESGFGGLFNWPVPSAALLNRMVHASNRRNLPFLLHATGLDGHTAAIDAGADILMHGLWHWPGSRLDTLPPASVGSLLKRMKARGTAVMPTMRVIEGEHDTWHWNLIDHPLLPDALPADWLGWLASEEGRWPQRELQALYLENLPISELLPERYLEASRARIRVMLHHYRDAGVRLLFGSDTPASEGIGNPPGLNGRLEITAWVRAGVPATEIFDALTRRNAQAFGLADSIGTLEVGKRADLLLLARNPQIDPDAYDTIVKVILAGVPLDRADLSARQSGHPSR